MEAVGSRNPVFDQAEVSRMVKDGVQKLTEMQLADGGWGWFSGWGEQSEPHTTAVVDARAGNRPRERCRTAAGRFGSRQRLAKELSGSAGAVAEKRRPARTGRTDLPNAPPTIWMRSCSWC